MSKTSPKLAQVHTTVRITDVLYTIAAIKCTRNGALNLPNSVQLTCPESMMLIVIFNTFLSLLGLNLFPFNIVFKRSGCPGATAVTCNDGVVSGYMGSDYRDI